MASMTVYVYTQELEKLRDFYQAALGVKPHDHGDWQPFDLAASTFAVHGRGAPDDMGRFIVQIDVDDIDTALARCEAHGATVLQGISDEAFGKRAVIEDPDGRTLYLVQNEMG